VRGTRLTIALWLIAHSALAQQSSVDVAAPVAARPKIALVLSGGGARGFAHVGVLRALKDMRIPIDMVAGVSMGAVVGAAYASGRSVEELEQFVRGTDWTSVVADRPPRDDLAFRRREDDLVVPSRIEFGLNRSGVVLPPGTAGNSVLESALLRLLPVGTSDLPVNMLPLPFRSVGSDLLTGELIELKNTPLFMSVRASLAVPGVFAPVRIDGRLIVDGGLVRNLPVDIARAMGADIVIAVNVGTPLADESELTSGIGVARQMLLILTEQNVQRSLKELGPRDVLISPSLEGISFLNFSLSERAMAAGVAAAHGASSRLAAYALSPEAYAVFERTRVGTSGVRDAGLPLSSVDVQATAHASGEALAAMFGLRAGDTATAAQVNQAATRLFGRGEFERIEVDMQDVGGKRELRVRPVEAEWARSRLRVGIEVVSDFADDNRFTVSGLHTLSWLNSWGAELRTLARVGSQRTLLTQWWQPLAPGADWYVAPTLQYNGSSIDIYEQGRRTLRFGFHETMASLTVGRQLSNWGDVHLGVDRRRGRSRLLVPEGGSASAGNFSQTAQYLQVQIDTLDSLVLPGRGGLLQGRYERSLGDGPQRITNGALGLIAFQADGWDSHVYAEWAKARSGTAPLVLGGFLRLSGTPRGSLVGQRVVLGRLVMARRIGQMPAGLGDAARAGFSLEAGNGFAPDESIRWGGMQQAASVFFCVDTRFGPLFLGAGATRGIGSSLYLFLGPFW
jgi:NTE family protein